MAVNAVSQYVVMRWMGTRQTKAKKYHIHAGNSAASVAESAACNADSSVMGVTYIVGCGIN